MKRAPMILLMIGVALGAAAYALWTPDMSRAELEDKYLESPCGYREVAGVRLHLCDSGPRDAQAVILLHGFGASLQTWDAWATSLQVDHRVIRFDLPGAGLTGPDPTGDYRDSRSVAVLEALMRELGLAHASIIGNSIGGRIAWTFAALKPALVDRLVLISPDGFASPGFAYGKAPDVPFILAAMRYVLPKPMLRMNLAPAYGDPKLLTDAVVTRYYDLMLAPGVRGALLERMRQTVLQDPVPLLRRIQAPTLLLWGEKDAMIPIANAADYLRELPHGELTRLPGLGHVPQEEAPDVSLAPVRAFLAR
jgi:pimeloyl-ACP methyl ester carboxylesterase